MRKQGEVNFLGYSKICRTDNLPSSGTLCDQKRGGDRDGQLEGGISDTKKNLPRIIEKLERSRSPSHYFNAKIEQYLKKRRGSWEKGRKGECKRVEDTGTIPDQSAVWGDKKVKKDKESQSLAIRILVPDHSGRIRRKEVSIWGCRIHNQEAREKMS